MIRFPWLLLSACTLLMLISCKGSPPKQVAKQQGRDNEGPGTIRGKGWHIRWTTRDPKNSTRALPLLDAEAEQGEMYYDDNVPTMRLKTVRAKLFRDGVHIANLRAGNLEASNEVHIVTGSQGVSLTSLEPTRKIMITADHMEWNIDNNNIVAEGNAKVERLALTNQPRGTAEAPRILLNTKTGEYELIGRAK